MSILGTIKAKDPLFVDMMSLASTPGIDQDTMFIVLGVLKKYAGKQMKIMKGYPLFLLLNAASKCIPQGVSTEADCVDAIVKGVGCSRRSAYRYLRQIRR